MLAESCRAASPYTMSKHVRRPRHARSKRAVARHVRPGVPPGRSVALVTLAVTGLVVPSQVFARTSSPHPVAVSLPAPAGDPSSSSPLPTPMVLPLDNPALVNRSAASVGLPAAPADGAAHSLPARAYAAYLGAERRAAAETPGCHLAWTVLAGVGQIESGHARSGGSGRPDWNGVAVPPVLGPTLSGGPFAAIKDTDGGALDGDPNWDRAVGPMQFLPSTWRAYAVDASGDGRPDPQDIADAAATAARYLCVSGLDLRSPSSLFTAVYSYNHSADYVRAVLDAALGYGATPGAAEVLLGLPPTSASTASRTPSPAPRPTAVHTSAASGRPSVAPSPQRPPESTSTPSSPAATPSASEPSPAPPGPSSSAPEPERPSSPACTC